MGIWQVFNTYPVTAISLKFNKHNFVYKVLTPSIKTLYKFIWTYGDQRHIYGSVAGNSIHYQET